MTSSDWEVISPLGGETVAANAGAPRLDGLDGKTICEMWNGDFKGNFTFPVYRELLAERYEGVKVIPYTEFPFSTIRGTPAHQRETDAAMIALARERGCDAVISGNGG